MSEIHKTVYERFGVVCGPGWVKLIEPLMVECQERGVTILQVKEKFGGLRFYVDAAPADLHDKIEAAEAESLRTCELCGEAGVTRNIKGWLRTVCEQCL
jgi:hypothetical protein